MCRLKQISMRLCGLMSIGKALIIMLLPGLISFVSCSDDEPTRITNNYNYYYYNDSTSQNDNSQEKQENTVIGSVPEGALKGVFSVSSTKKVYFSQGNLQYKASTNTWRFAEKQYDVIGAENSKVSSTNSSWIDLFGFATSGYQGKNPYMSSSNYEDYGNGMNNISQTEYDWGVRNAISNGGNVAGKWYTMTVKEWEFIFEKRPNAANLISIAKVNGMQGLVILPDGWVLPQGVSFKPGLKDYYSLSENIYTVAEWTKMEEAGAVFLPCAGVRRSTNVSEVGTSGYYWQSDGVRVADGGREVWFGNSYLNYNPGTAGDFGRASGISVRLVTSVM